MNDYEEYKDKKIFNMICFLENFNYIRKNSKNKGLYEED